MGFFVFITIFISICFIGNFYIFKRLAGLFEIKFTPWLYLPIFILSISYVGAAVLEGIVNNFLTRILYVISSTWLGIGLILLSCLAVFEVVNIFVKIAEPFAGGIIIAAALLLSIMSMINARILCIKEIEIPAPVDMKIVQLSDLHIGSVGAGFLDKVVSKTNSLYPDVVLITGDLVDPQADLGQGSLAALNDLKAPAFFVTGNHERYADLDRVALSLKGTNVKWLKGEKADFSGIEIIGIGDSDSKSYVSNQLDRIQFDAEKFNVLMYHRPVDFEVAAEKGIDLMLTGHTHNGQITPFNFFVRLFFDKMKGLYEHNSAYLYVCPGTGTWGPRMRLGSRSEIVLIKLKKS